MPPQVTRSDAGTPVHSHPVSAEQSKTAEVDKNAAQKQEPPKQDAETAAKNAEAAKQHAGGKKQQNVADEQMMRNKLDQRVPDKKTEKSATTAQKPTANQSGAWAFVKEAAGIASKAAATGVETIRDTTAKAAVTKGVATLHQKEYRQDMVKGEYFEVEKITPGTTDKTKTTERVEDRSRGDVASRKYHQEQHRTSTQSGLDGRLKELNQGKELTQFEKGLVSEWDPQMKARGNKDPITAVSPIMGVDSSGTKGSTEVQAYKVQRGLETTYYDRNGNTIEPESRQQKMLKLDQRKYPQDKVRGELFEVENITPGNTNKTKNREHADDLGLKDMYTGNLHPSQHRTSDQTGLENRLKELNQGTELTAFEKGLVSEWDPQRKSGAEGKDPITSVSPIIGSDSSGKKRSAEVEGYKVQRGVSGNLQTTYYDRHGNELLAKRSGGEAIPTDSPIDYATDAKILKDVVVGAGEKIVERFAKETTSITTKVEKGAIVNSVEQKVAKAEAASTSHSVEQQVAKAETGTATKTAEKQTTQAETREASRSKTSSKNDAVPKPTHMSREADIKKELEEIERGLEGELSVARDIISKDGGRQLNDPNSIKARLRGVTGEHKEDAQRVLDAINELEARRGKLRREQQGFPDWSDF